MAPHDVMRKSCCREFSRKTSRLPVLLLFFGSPASAPLQICFLNHHFCEFISTDLFVLQFSFSVFESGDFQDIILLPDILPYIKRLSCYLLWIFFALQILLVVLIFFFVPPLITFKLCTKAMNHCKCFNSVLFWAGGKNPPLWTGGYYHFKS